VMERLLLIRMVILEFKVTQSSVDAQILFYIKKN
jgi:hypothetical protein